MKVVVGESLGTVMQIEERNEQITVLLDNGKTLDVTEFFMEDN